MAVTAFNGQFSFRQDTLSRLGHTGSQGMSADDYRRFQTSPFMQGVRKTEDLCQQWTYARDQIRAKKDPSFKPKDTDFSAPKSHEYVVGMDYYKVLGVDEHATLEDVKKAYKKLSLVYHPDKTSGMDQSQKDEYAAIFIELKNAYRTLSDNPTRRQYDRDRDRDKASRQIHGYKEKKQVQFDATEILKKLKEAQKPPGKIVDVPVSVKLEKFIYGGQKALLRQRRVKVRSGDFASERKLYWIDVQKGSEEPYECAFRCQGDHHLDTMPDTVNFRIQSKPHPFVRRRGQDVEVKTAPRLDKASRHLQLEIPSVRGQLTLLWGPNPFAYSLNDDGHSELRVQIAGEGVGGGCLRLSCSSGPDAASAASLSQAKASVNSEVPGVRAPLDELAGFLARHKLGPPSQEATGGVQSGGSAASQAHVEPAMQRRVQRMLRERVVCEVTLHQVGVRRMLFTRPACTVTCYASVASPGSAAPGRPCPSLFAISISAPTCASKKMWPAWNDLKASLVPLLWATRWWHIKASMAILPRALQCEPKDTSQAPTEDLPKQDMSDSDLPQKAPLQMPWKRLGDEAFKRGEYFTAMALYTRCIGNVEPDAEDQDAVIAVSNRAACLAKVGHYHASLADARQVLELRPCWSRAWARAGFAASKLGKEFQKEALDAFFRAVEFEPEPSRVEYLRTAAVQALKPCAEEAHRQKERGNAALLEKKWGHAVACFTVGVALTPLAPASGEDEHALLRSVLLSNRAGALLHCSLWPAALEDARLAVAAKGDFVKARNRLGAALLATSCPEHAYAEFARALQFQHTNEAALRGREACLAALPRWTSTLARQRFQDRFSTDFVRQAGSTKVYAISDLHFDHRCNEDWTHRIDDVKFQDDVIIVAGNLCHSRNALVRALTTLKAKFRRVFFVPGNLDLSLHPSEAARYPDSFAKLLAIIETCDDLGVDVAPAAICEDVFVVPLFSWYTCEFDAQDPSPDLNSTADSSCKWPLDPDCQLWKYMLRLNDVHLNHPYHGKVVTFSHFLPRRDLKFHPPSAAKAMGCEGLEAQLRRVRSTLHVYGHSNRRQCLREDGVTYVNRYHGEERGKFEENATLLCVYDGQAVVHKEVNIS